MAIEVNLFNASTGDSKNAAMGFSWTVFIFGPFPPLFRRDWGGAIIIGFVNIVMASIIPWSNILSAVFFGFTYNKQHLKRLIDAGYSPQGDENFNTSVKNYAESTQADLNNYENKSNITEAQNGGALLLIIIGLFTTFGGFYIYNSPAISIISLQLTAFFAYWVFIKNRE